jgi:hypothetical protein
MMRRFLGGICIAALATSAGAWPYSNATTPYTGNENWPCSQVGPTVVCSSAAIAAIATGTSGVALPHAANNAALQALAHTAYPVVIRDGFAAKGDAPPIMYIPSASACSLGSGAGDGGSQVPTSDGGCWLAVFPNATADLREWGASTSGTAATLTALTKVAALPAALRVVVPVGTFAIGNPSASNCPQLNFTSATSLVGASPTASILQLPAGCTLTGDVFEWNGVNGDIENLTIDENTPAVGSLAAVVSFRAYAGNVTSAIARNLTIINGSSEEFQISAAACNNPCTGGGGLTGHTMTGLVIAGNHVAMTAATSQNQCIGLTTVGQTGIITKFQVTDNVCVGSAFQIDGDNGVVSGNDISGFKFGGGIFTVFGTGQSGLTSDHDNTIIGNNVHDTTTGVDANNAAHMGYEMTCVHCTITGNQAHNLGGAGFVNYGDYATFTGNVAYDNGANGSGGAGGIGDEAGFTLNYSGTATHGANLGTVMGAGNVAFDDGAGTQLYGLLAGSNGTGNTVRVVAGSTYSGVTQAIDDVTLGTIQADWLFEKTVIASNSSAITFNGLDTGSYRQWEMTCSNINPASAVIIYLQVAEGGVFETGAHYAEQAEGAEAGSAVNINSTVLNGINLSKTAVDNTNATPSFYDFKFGDLNFANVGAKVISFQSGYQVSGSGTLNGSGWWVADTTGVNGVRLIAASGNIQNGGCTLRGRPL